MICWAWWYTMASRNGHHRCGEPEGHSGLHVCCCGAVMDVATHSTVRPSPLPVPGTGEDGQ